MSSYIEELAKVLAAGVPAEQRRSSPEDIQATVDIALDILARWDRVDAERRARRAGVAPLPGHAGDKSASPPSRTRLRLVSKDGLPV